MACRMVTRRNRVVSDWVRADEAHLAVVVVGSFSYFACSHGMGSGSCSCDILSRRVCGNAGHVGVVTTTATPLAASSVLIALSSASSSVALTLALLLRIGSCGSCIAVSFR